MLARPWVLCPDTPPRRSASGWRARWRCGGAPRDRQHWWRGGVRRVGGGNPPSHAVGAVLFLLSRAASNSLQYPSDCESASADAFVLLRTLSDAACSSIFFFLHIWVARYRIALPCFARPCGVARRGWRREAVWLAYRRCVLSCRQKLGSRGQTKRRYSMFDWSRQLDWGIFQLLPERPYDRLQSGAYADLLYWRRYPQFSNCLRTPPVQDETACTRPHSTPLHTAKLPI